MAEAGPDQVVIEGDFILLSATKSHDPDGDILKYTWAQTDRHRPVTLKDSTAVVASFTAPDVDGDTTLQFTLMVSDGTHTSQDTVLVEVLDSLDSASVGPTADAGSDQTVVTGDMVTLNGSGSSKPADKAISYEWIQSLGTPVTLSNATSSVVTFLAPPVTQSEILVFLLTVRGNGVVSFDDVVVTVFPVDPTTPGGGGNTTPDNCPNDPNKTDPGRCGCGVADIDSDGDGTLDCHDGCPNDPNKTDPGQCGCGVVDIDSDGDGTLDCLDGCPNDPNKTAPGLCKCGTADTDSNNNGVPDCQDPCPPGQNGDSDGDGVSDCVDGCPTDPAKSSPGVCGCQASDVDSDGDGVPDCIDQCTGQPDVDSDGDGVLDCNDGCPSDPGKTNPGTCGCGIAEVDTDQDGIFDCNDGCPNDPAKVNPGACGCGTADVDSNGDGVPDCLATGCLNNLLTNSGFENGGTGWMYTSSGGRAVVSTEAHSGSWSQEVNVSTRSPHIVAQGVSVGAGFVYDASCWVKLNGVGGTGASVDLEWQDNAGSAIQTDTIAVLSGTTAWGEMAGSFAAPAGAVTVRLGLHTAVDPDGLGQAWFDDCTLCSGGNDTDGDGVPDSQDSDPNNPNLCTDNDNDGCDDCSSGSFNPAGDGPDADGDGVCDAGDICPGFDDTVDSNGNGVPDGCEPPVLCVSTTALNFGFTASQTTLQVWNCGGGSLGYTVTDDASWLSVSPTSGTSSGQQNTITATVDRTGLPSNTYQGNIIVTPTVGSVLTVLVSMTVAQSGGAAPTISLVVSRTSGVSPLGVFFDASGTTSPTTSRPFHDLDYTWDFGDPGSTFVFPRNLDGSTVDANRAKAPMAAHVFELSSQCSGSGVSCDTSADCPTGQTCGVSRTYTVTLTVRDKTGATAQAQQLITVDPFPDTGNTFFVSSSGSDSNTGLTKVTSFKTWDKAITMLFLSNGPRRVLFRRGDTFTDPTPSANISSKAGPYLIAAYGNGAKPVIRTTHNATTLRFHAPSVRDVRVADIHFNGPNLTGASGNALNVGSDFLFLRDKIENHFHSIIAGGGTTTGSLVVDCNILNSENYGIFYSASGVNPPPNHIAIMACELNGVNREHLIRTFMTKSLITYNKFQNGLAVKTNLAYKAPAGSTVQQASQLASRYSVISSNHFTFPNAGTTIVAIGPENTNARELVENVIVENNVWDAGPNNSSMDAVQSNGANHITLRNNVFIDMRSWVVMSGPVPGFSTWDNWKIYHNTGYRSVGGDTIIIRAHDNRGVVAPTNLAIRNNIASVPSATGGVVRVLFAPDTPLANMTVSNNLWHFPLQVNSTLFEAGGSTYTFAAWRGLGKDSASSMADPRFVSPASDNFQLRTSNPTSPAIDGGVAIPEVFEDFVSGLRPKRGGYDIGAYEMP